MTRARPGCLIVIAVISIVIILARMGEHHDRRRPVEIEPEPDRSSRIWAETRDLIPFQHRWEDVTLAMRDWSGDAALVDPTVVLPEMTLTSNIDRARLHDLLGCFGIPDRWIFAGAILRGYHSRLPARGFNAVRRGGEVEIWPDYPWIVRESTSDLGHVTAELQALTRQGGARTHRERLRIFASFVQSMTYRIPPPYRTLPDGERVYTAGILVPTEVLYHKWGDCDSKSLLFTSMLANLPGQSVIFLTGYDHLFVGVRAVPRTGDTFIKIQGVPHVLVELTSPWPIGRIPSEYAAHVRRGAMEIIPVLD